MTAGAMQSSERTYRGGCALTKTVSRACWAAMARGVACLLWARLSRRGRTPWSRWSRKRPGRAAQGWDFCSSVGSSICSRGALSMRVAARKDVMRDPSRPCPGHWAQSCSLYCWAFVRAHRRWSSSLALVAEGVHLDRVELQWGRARQERLG